MKSETDLKFFYYEIMKSELKPLSLFHLIESSCGY